ncbi:unnamed protein product [Gulo gulo]|uniref:Uncharacterized protein n=1 Tax=Gulo gulo TaxID=48420 RepID=A0A9X9Q1Q9_GULGU|nr:unnamed protein product [Gulo gulo]
MSTGNSESQPLTAPLSKLSKHSCSFRPSLRDLSCRKKGRILCLPFFGCTVSTPLTV